MALAPFILLGAEPTCNPNLPWLAREIRKYGPVAMVTNGLKLADMGYLQDLDGFMTPGIFNVCISINPRCNDVAGDYDRRMQAVENVLSLGFTLYGLMFVIDALDQLDEVIEVCQSCKGRVMDTRIKVSTDFRGDGTADIFNSDIFRYLCGKAAREGVTFGLNRNLNNKHIYTNMIYDGINLAAVKWYTKHNVDLNDINCPPWSLQSDGKILDFGYSLILGGAQ